LPRILNDVALQVVAIGLLRFLGDPTGVLVSPLNLVMRDVNISRSINSDCRWLIQTAANRGLHICPVRLQSFRIKHTILLPRSVVGVVRDDVDVPAGILGSSDGQIREGVDGGLNEAAIGLQRMLENGEGSTASVIVKGVEVAVSIYGKNGHDIELRLGIG